MFDDRFEVVLADTEESKAIHYRLRYQVFCLEKGFECAEKHKNKMEKDQYDDGAIHFLVKEKQRQQWIGAARLVLGRIDTLPMTRVASLEVPDLAPDMLFAEFSRLLILDDFRHTRHEGIAEPEVLLGLFRAAREYSRINGVKHWGFLCRRSIYRILRGVGIQLQQIGPTCLHRGVRAPYHMNLHTAFDGVATRSPRAHRMFGRSLSYYCHSALCRDIAA